jgi:SAM-dependent methyltransferase
LLAVRTSIDSAAGFSAGPATLGTESSSWWDRNRMAFLCEQLRGALPGPNLDVGCGRGTIASALAQPGVLSVACDIHAYPEWAAPGPVRFVVASADRLPFRAGAFGNASALDVLEHFADDQHVAGELRRIVAPGGKVVVTVPAFQQLWSEHDEAVGHFRRYDVATLTAALAAAGLRIQRRTYFFAWLALAGLLLRSRRGSIGDGSASAAGGLIGRVADVLGRVERRWLRGHRLPVGTSLFAIATND